MTEARCKAVISFLSDTLPYDSDRGGWDHRFSTAYQIGCEALIKLGQADETPWGATRCALSELPPLLPRWDDLCIAVLWLANQTNKISFRLPDGETPPMTIGAMTVTVIGRPPPPPPNISATQGLGPARAADEVLELLETMGLVRSGTWTATAEPALWRIQPRNWGMDVTTHPRFIAAVNQTVDTIPQDVREEVDALLNISKADVASLIAKSAADHEEARAKYGPKARIGAPYTEERARQFLTSVRRNDLDWVFFRKWRLEDIWLTPEEQVRALGIFHDRLACAMRRAVMARLYPDLAAFSA